MLSCCLWLLSARAWEAFSVGWDDRLVFGRLEDGGWCPLEVGKRDAEASEAMVYGEVLEDGLAQVGLVVQAKYGCHEQGWTRRSFCCMVQTEASHGGRRRGNRKDYGCAEPESM